MVGMALGARGQRPYPRAGGAGFGFAYARNITRLNSYSLYTVSQTYLTESISHG